MFNTSANCIDFVEKVSAVLEDQSEWSQQTFGTDAVRGPQGPLDHLEKEAVEASVAAQLYFELKQDEGSEGTRCLAIARERFLTELADCQLLLWDAMRRGLFKIQDLVKACSDKMVVNRQRRWPPPGDPTKAVEHIREEKFDGLPSNLGRDPVG